MVAFVVKKVFVYTGFFNNKYSIILSLVLYTY